jgi:hypothetical protein
MEIDNDYKNEKRERISERKKNMCMQNGRPVVSDRG